MNVGQCTIKGILTTLMMLGKNNNGEMLFMKTYGISAPYEQ
jgi:hypothetical protein